jgi:RHS repeat-associated protein
LVLLRSAGTVATPLQFTGQYADVESGLLYLRARHYDPATAQFITVDPALELTRSPYGYLGGNPLSGADPTGLCSFWCVVAIGAVVGVGVACVVFEPCGLIVGGAGALAGAGALSLGAGIAIVGGTTVAAGAAVGGLGGAIYSVASSANPAQEATRRARAARRHATYMANWQIRTWTSRTSAKKATCTFRRTASSFAFWTMEMARATWWLEMLQIRPANRRRR